MYVNTCCENKKNNKKIKNKKTFELKSKFFCTDYFAFRDSYNAKIKVQFIQQMNLKVFKVSPKAPDIIMQNRKT